MHIKTRANEPARMKTGAALIIGLAASGLLAAPVFADQASELRAEALRAEVAAQRDRLDALEKKLLAAATESSKSAAATAAVGNEKAGLFKMPKGFAIYGIADAGVEFGDYGQGGRARVQSGLGSASRLGFKGERSFANDMTAYFQLEAGVSIDNGQNTGHSSNVSNPGQGSASSSAPNTTGVAIFSRNTFVGLRGNFGNVRFGRDYAPIYSITSASDPFTVGGATAFRLWSGAAASRFDNAVFYATPKIAGFGANVAYSAGMENNSTSNVGVTGANTSTGPKDEGKGWSANLTYNNGPLSLGTGYLSFLRTGTVAAPATENVERTSWNLAATYDLKFAKFYAHWLEGKDEQAGKAKTLDRQVWWLGVAVPFGGAHTVRAVYSHLNDRMSTDRDSDHIGLGYEYALDKETDLYAYYAQVTNKNGGKNSLCAGGTCQGFDGDTNLPANFTPKSLMLGARYRF